MPGWKRDQGDHSFISQSKPSQYANIDRRGTLADRNFAFEFAFACKRLSGATRGQRSIVVFGRSRKNTGKKNGMSCNELAKRLTAGVFSRFRKVLEIAKKGLLQELEHMV